jgi:hypothetical protein
VVFEERDRLARDLHDTVIQRLFAAGRSLQGIAGSAKALEVSDRIQTVVGDLDDTIRQLRSVIFGLGLVGNEPGLRSSVISLLQELRVVVGFDVRSSFDGPVDGSVPDQVAEHLLAAVREAVTNIGRHAQATQAEVLLRVDNDECLLEVTDNGRGLGDGEPSSCWCTVWPPPRTTLKSSHECNDVAAAVARARSRHTPADGHIPLRVRALLTVALTRTKLGRVVAQRHSRVRIHPIWNPTEPHGLLPNVSSLPCRLPSCTAGGTRSFRCILL